MHIDDSDTQRLEQPNVPEGGAYPARLQFSDRLVDKVLLWMFPYSVRPNHMTIARFILTPVVLVLLYYEHRIWAFGVFAIAVSTDFVDGSMARMRNQITKVGMVIDPVADKLLIGSVLAWVGYKYLVVQIILAVIFLELVMLAVGISTAKPGDRVRPANVFGKTKMVIQSVALVLFLISGMFDLKGPLTVSLYMLWVAVFLAVLSGIGHLRERFSKPSPPEGKTARPA